MAFVFNLAGVLLAVFAYVTPDLETAARFCAAVFAGICSILGAVYYVYAIIEKRRNLKQKSNI
jgi:hypothetical protein